MRVERALGGSSVVVGGLGDRAGASSVVVSLGLWLCIYLALLVLKLLHLRDRVL